MIPYSRQNISEDDIAAVVRVLRSPLLTQGPEVPLFEKNITEYCGARYGVAVSNGTAALHIACQAMGLGQGDWLWTSPITFVSSANCARYCGASVDFVDIDSETYNISVSALSVKLALAEKAGRLPKIVVPVHLAGLPCDLEAIWELADRYGFYILEDASHALGATYHGEPIGSCRWSHATVFSFHPVKMITTAEGGMVVTNDASLDSKLQKLRSHGITKKFTEMTERSHGPWYYEQIELGNNYRLTEIQAALGTSQMHRLRDFLIKRKELAARYDHLLTDFPLRMPVRLKDRESSWHLYIVRVDFSKLGLSQRDCYEGLHRAGAGVQLHYIPVHLQPYYRALGFRPGDFPAAEAYYREVISLPLYVDFKESEQDAFVQMLRATLFL